MFNSEDEIENLPEDTSVVDPETGNLTYTHYDYKCKWKEVPGKGQRMIPVGITRCVITYGPVQRSDKAIDPDVARYRQMYLNGETPDTTGLSRKEILRVEKGRGLAVYDLLASERYDAAEELMSSDPKVHTYVYLAGMCYYDSEYERREIGGKSTMSSSRSSELHHAIGQLSGYPRLKELLKYDKLMRMEITVDLD